MNNKFRNNLVVLFLLVMGLLSGPCFAAINQMTSIRIWPSPENTRLVFDVDHELQYEVKIFPNPDRILIHFKNVCLKTNVQAIQLKHSGIRHIKQETKGSDLILTLFLEKTVKLNYFKLPPIESYGHRVVLDLSQEPKNEKAEILALFQDEPQKPLQKAPVSVTPHTTPSAAASHPSHFVIAIDPGHGGEDPGAVGKRGTKEKTIVLAIAKQLKTLIEKEKGMKAVLMRSGDYYVSLQERVMKARRYKADLFVSIHADAFHDHGVEGASVFVLSEKGASSAAARWLAERENRSDLVGGVRLKGKSKDLASVLLDMSQIASKEEGQLAAKYILTSLNRISKLHTGKVERAGFLVLKAPDIPSLLVETGFISNPKTELKLRSSDYQKKLAESILSGIKVYVDKKSLIHGPQPE